MSVPPKDTSRLRACGDAKLADRLTSESSEPRRMIENHGLKSEVLCVSKLDRVKIINTAEKNSERSRIVVTIQSTACLTIVHAKPTGETTIAHHRSVLTAHISSP